MKKFTLLQKLHKVFNRIKVRRNDATLKNLSWLPKKINGRHH